ncbi:universal stress protein [Candidatus Amarobacter glycogenicus]|uniref:universal stress protein n=1 Tax=Candidatus Amarobacter glycogenicus TaxID=3140699 RepID=UPI0031CCA1F6
MFKRLLLAFDGSTHSREALSHAIGMAEALHAELYILHAYAPITSSSPLDDADEFLDLEQAGAMRILSPAIINAQRTGVVVHPAIVEGPAAAAIVRGRRTRLRSHHHGPPRPFPMEQVLLEASATTCCI